MRNGRRVCGFAALNVAVSTAALAVQPTVTVQHVRPYVVGSGSREAESTVQVVEVVFELRSDQSFTRVYVSCVAMDGQQKPLSADLVIIRNLQADTPAYGSARINVAPLHVENVKSVTCYVDRATDTPPQ